MSSKKEKLRCESLGVGGPNSGEFHSIVIHQYNRKIEETFTGSGLDDATFSNIYTGTESTTFKIIISSNNDDQFQWCKKTTGAYGDLSAEIPIVPGSEYEIEKGFTVKFDASDGHTINEYWEVKFILIGGLQILNPDGIEILSINGSGLGWGT